MQEHASETHTMSCPELDQQRIDVLLRAINNILALDPNVEKSGAVSSNGASNNIAKCSYRVSTYIRKVDKLIERIDRMCENQPISADTMEKMELYRGRLEERVAQLSEYIDQEEQCEDNTSNELASQRKQLLMDDVDSYLRIPALNVPTNRRQALIDKGDRYIERLENLGYYHLQDTETLKQIRAYKKDIQKQINELCRGSDGVGTRGNTWSSDNVLNDQRMEILFKDIEQFVNIAPGSISASRRSATVMKGDKLIEKLLQYGYYHLLDKETLEKVQRFKQELEKQINELSKLVDEQPGQSGGGGGGASSNQGFGGYRRQHSANYERNIY